MGVLDGKVVVVTGAGGGIGAEIAKYAAREGASVVVNDLGCGPGGDGADAGPAQIVADEIVAAGGSAVANGDTVATWEGAQAIIQSAIDAFGRIDGVVNNAGVLRDKLFHKIDVDQWAPVRSVNLDGSFFVSRAAAPHFREQESGAFVHMTSTSGLIGNYGQSNYMAAKLGVAGLSKSIALDMKRFNVRSNCIAPWAMTRLIGEIKTDNSEQNRNRVEAFQSMTADKVAPFAVALLSDGAANVSGQIFSVRKNEIMLFSQPRPIRTMHTAEGWTPETCIERVFPAFEGSFFPIQITAEVIPWDPV
ncbi:SDR family NAD(P)-dependent oxidoreductase [Novosphingobium pentaromativorans]|uniref:Short-chain dehydrogenase n=1 Tax=Novosphingobium pentaromativorans US6-1 TaxID=1088721 RepID=G6EGF0_9SPHN|nr:SDR family NAD(P)-dependent oxidoreductase [Novosphingobium pentaromativorans]AIT82125.1 3-hydroxyacyl-CoA dehydrogenase [Novosphingobium pentaromativorans US6-1]EHJ59601.1 short-chain dehydrogenase [Novosphingobium pentaromativorans US6-1]